LHDFYIDLHGNPIFLHMDKTSAPGKHTSFSWQETSLQ